MTVGARPLKRRLARPHLYLHAERLAISGDDGSDPAVAIDAERLVAQRVTDADLPMAGLQRRHLLRYRAHRRQHQPPGEFGRGIGVSACWPDDTMMPSLVQASISMWG